MSTKEEWANTGKGIGKTVVGLGKALLKTVKVGAEKILDETPEEKEVPLKDTWSEVGQTIGNTGKSFGKAIANTARDLADLIDDEKPAEAAELFTEETIKD